MGVKLVRIDDRLIHGQVATTWIKNYGIEQVLIIDDKAKKDPMQQSVANFAAPQGVKVIIFGVDQFIAIMKKNEIKKATLLLFTSPINVLKVVEAGLDISEINAGGMRFNETRKRVTKAISVTPDEHKSFLALIDKGIHINVQMIPNDQKEDYVKLSSNL